MSNRTASTEALVLEEKSSTSLCVIVKIELSTLNTVSSMLDQVVGTLLLVGRTEAARTKSRKISTVNDINFSNESRSIWEMDSPGITAVPYCVSACPTSYLLLLFERSSVVVVVRYGLHGNPVLNSEARRSANDDSSCRVTINKSWMITDMEIRLMSRSHFIN